MTLIFEKSRDATSSSSVNKLLTANAKTKGCEIYRLLYSRRTSNGVGYFQQSKNIQQYHRVRRYYTIGIFSVLTTKETVNVITYLRSLRWKFLTHDGPSIKHNNINSYQNVSNKDWSHMIPRYHRNAIKAHMIFT